MISCFENDDDHDDNSNSNTFIYGALNSTLMYVQRALHNVNDVL